MMNKRKNKQRGLAAAMGVGLVLAGGGCSMRDAVLDGLFGGVRDTIATVVSGALLNAMPMDNCAG